MRRSSRDRKKLVIFMLMFSIAALSIGFAAFSASLNISSQASITPNSDTFSVKFSTNKDSLVGAINELVDITPVSEDVIGKLNDLHTNEKETIVAAINDLYYLKQDVADPDIECEEKSVVGAINLSVKSTNKTIKDMIVLTSEEYNTLITPDENGVKLVDPYTMYILIDVVEEGGD